MKRFLVFLIFALSCHPSTLPNAGGTLPGMCPGGIQILETMTYNVGLAPGVEPYATPRIAPVAQELGKFRDMGVMCIEEAWTKESKEAIVSALGLPPENVFYVDTSGQGDDLSNVNVCKPGQLDAVAACARSNCDELPTEEQSRCAYASCKDELVSLYGVFTGGDGADCLNCLVSSVGQDINETLRECSTPGHGRSHAYGGQNGEILVSRFPLKNKEALLLPSSIANRVGLFATVEIDGREPIEVACMHDATSGDVPPSHRGPDGKRVFSDWNDEMNAQLQMVSDRLKERAGNRPQILLGDVNAGPAIGKTVTEDEPRVWSRIVSLGFTSPATQAVQPFCSVCSDNTQRLIESPHPGNHLIDHVLVRDPPGGSTLIPVCARRLLDTDHEAYYPGYDGQLVEGHLSDHYAVAVSFRYE